MAVGTGDNCFICDLTDVYLLVWIPCLRWDRIIGNVNSAELAVLRRKGLNSRLHEDQQQFTGSTCMLHNVNPLPVSSVYI